MSRPVGRPIKIMGKECGNRYGRIRDRQRKERERVCERERVRERER